MKWESTCIQAVTLTFVGAVTDVVFDPLSDHRHSHHEHQGQDRRDGTQRRNNRNRLKHRNYQKVNVRKAAELGQQTKWQVGNRSVLGGPYIVGLVVVLLVTLVVVNVESARLRVVILLTRLHEIVLVHLVRGVLFSGHVQWGGIVIRRERLLCGVLSLPISH